VCHRLSRKRVQELLDRLCSLPLGRRREIIGLEPARANVIVTGALLTREILDLFGFDELTVSDGMLAGIGVHPPSFQVFSSPISGFTR